MKAKVSKTFVATMNKQPEVKAAGMVLHYVTFTPDQYFKTVSYLYRWEDATKNGMLAAVMITYSDQYYAMPAYITTFDIRQCAISAETFTMKDFIKEFVERYAI